MYRIVMIQVLDKGTDIDYCCLSLINQTTECYRSRYKRAYEIWCRIDHNGSPKENRGDRSKETCIHTQTTTAHSWSGSVYDPTSCRVLQRQRTHDIPDDQERRAQSVQAEERPSDQTRRFAGLVRGTCDHRERQGRDGALSLPDVYLVCTSQYNSASSELSWASRTDAAMDKPWMDKPCLNSTLRLLVRQLSIRGSPVPLHLLPLHHDIPVGRISLLVR